MNKKINSKLQDGSLTVIVIVILAVCLTGTVGYVAYSNITKNNDKVAEDNHKEEKKELVKETSNTEQDKTNEQGNTKEQENNLNRVIYIDTCTKSNEICMKLPRENWGLMVTQNKISFGNENIAVDNIDIKNEENKDIKIKLSAKFPISGVALCSKNENIKSFIIKSEATNISGLGQTHPFSNSPSLDRAYTVSYIVKEGNGYKPQITLTNIREAIRSGAVLDSCMGSKTGMFDIIPDPKGKPLTVKTYNSKTYPTKETAIHALNTKPWKEAFDVIKSTKYTN